MLVLKPYFLGSVSEPPMTVPIMQIASNINGVFTIVAAVGLFFMTIVVARMTWFLAVWMPLTAIALGLSGI